MGWAKDNLSAEERRAIAEELIRQGGGKLTQHDGGRGELVALCPLHQESNPSFSYSYTKDVYNCSSGCGGGDLAKLWAEVNGMDNKAGFKAFKQKYGPQGQAGGDRRARDAKGGAGAKKKADQAPAKVIPEEAWEALELLPGEWVDKLIAKRAWTRQGIEKAGLRLWRAPEGEARRAALEEGIYAGRPGDRRIAIPVRDEKGRLVNIRLYLPGAEAYKVVSWGKGYGKTRLWPGEGNK